VVGDDDEWETRRRRRRKDFLLVPLSFSPTQNII
jgi:hypothetical protein